MTFLTDNNKKISSGIAVIVALVASVGLVFFASSPLANSLPAIGWILLALIAIAVAGFVWLAWGVEPPKVSAAKSSTRELSTTESLRASFESLTLLVAMIAVLVWISPWVGFASLAAVPFGLGAVSVIALVLDLLSKTGRLAVRWRLFEVGASVFAILSIVATAVFLATT